MNIPSVRSCAFLLLSGVVAMGAGSKTITPNKVANNLIGKAPYRYNGVVKAEKGRGSGFCAWNKRTFFSAAHVVLDIESGAWKEPPSWYPQTHSLKLEEDNKIQSRGYLRWTTYRQYAFEEEFLDPDAAFGRDVIVGFAFKDLIKGTPAMLNLNGHADLKGGVKALMTGYPARNAYTNDKINGFFLHQTGPTAKPYQQLDRAALETTLITTGPGNSGGPIWTQRNAKQWAASGVVVGGRPSESVVYAFTSETNVLLRAVGPVVEQGGPQSVLAANVSSSSRFFSDQTAHQLPDGVHKWTNVPFRVNGFLPAATVKTVRLSVQVKTPHRGDLIILLSGPGGFETVIHNEEGANARNLVINSKDVTEDFFNIPVDGTWTVRFQDRLVGDICTVQSVVLEIEAEETSPGG